MAYSTSANANDSGLQIIREHDEIKAVPHLQMRWLGHRLRAEVTLALDPDLTIVQGEAITDHITHHLYHALPTFSEATIAVIPWDGNLRWRQWLAFWAMRR